MHRDTDLKKPLSGETPWCGFSVHAEGACVIVGSRHGNGAEYAIAFSSCHNSKIIVGVFFQAGTAVCFDHCAVGSGLCRCGLVPVPFSFGVCCQKDVVSAASVDDFPGDLLLKIIRSAADIFPGIIFRRRGNKCDVGPWTILSAF